ncbi:MAG: hypothetical protein NT099_02160 [Candidatus Saganbacteria bacterium]|nr:hypothetical protein [Candidatus Saganbacteria bacterium]
MKKVIVFVLASVLVLGLLSVGFSLETKRDPTTKINYVLEFTLNIKGKPTVIPNAKVNVFKWHGKENETKPMFSGYTDRNGQLEIPLDVSTNIDSSSPYTIAIDWSKLAIAQSAIVEKGNPGGQDKKYKWYILASLKDNNRKHPL